MTYLGFGLFRFGTSPFGYGTPAQTTVDRTPLYQQEDGTEGTARIIDLATKDYVLDETTGKFIGTGQIEQMVYLALVTNKGTSLVTSLGQTFRNITVISDNIKVRVEDEVNQALSELMSLKLVTLEEVEVSVSRTRRLNIAVHWKDVATDALHKTDVEI